MIVGTKIGGFENLEKIFTEQELKKALNKSMRKSLKPVVETIKSRVPVGGNDKNPAHLRDDLKIHKKKSNYDSSFVIKTSKKTRMYASLIEFGRSRSFHTRRWSWGKRTAPYQHEVAGIKAHHFMLGGFHQSREKFLSDLADNFIRDLLHGKGKAA